MCFHLPYFLLPTTVGIHLGYLQVASQDTGTDFSLTLRCALGEQKGSQQVLVVLRVLRVSTAEQNRQLQVLGSGYSIAQRNCVILREWNGFVRHFCH